MQIFSSEQVCIEYDEKVPHSQGRIFKDKVTVMGMLERGENEIIERPHKVIPNKTVKENGLGTIPKKSM